MAVNTAKRQNGDNFCGVYRPIVSESRHDMADSCAALPILRQIDTARQNVLLYGRKNDNFCGIYRPMVLASRLYTAENFAALPILPHIGTGRLKVLPYGRKSGKIAKRRTFLRSI